MLGLSLDVGDPPRVLCLGAHCDDIDLGCGGTLLRLRAEHPGIEIRWVIFCSDPRRAAEASASAERFLGSLGDDQVVVHAFRDGFLPWQGVELKEAFERLKDGPRPDLVFTHARHDLHQDHRQVCELTWNTFRDHLILEYEIPKWDGDLVTPNVYVGLDEFVADEKARILLESYPSQRRKQWFDADTLRGLMRLRGVECNAPGRFAEGFVGRKLLLEP
jgi:LmbE family N-acetylglucosaminyl deacetylase